MSFKKFLAPVMSCCCIVSSLVSPCKALFKYSDLIAIEITEVTDSKKWDGKNNLSIVPDSARTVFVSNKLENLPKDQTGKIRCGKCQLTINNISDGFVIGHSDGPLYKFHDLDSESSSEYINKNTNTMKEWINHLICKDCLLKIIKETSDDENDYDEGGNKCLECPCPHESSYFNDHKSKNIYTLKIKGQPIAPENRDLSRAEKVCFFLIMGAGIIWGIGIKAAYDDIIQNNKHSHTIKRNKNIRMPETVYFYDDYDDLEDE